jgi:hypothetical protein
MRRNVREDWPAELRIPRPDFARYPHLLQLLPAGRGQVLAGEVLRLADMGAAQLIATRLAIAEGAPRIAAAAPGSPPPGQSAAGVDARYGATGQALEIPAQSAVATKPRFSPEALAAMDAELDGSGP